MKTNHYLTDHIKNHGPVELKDGRRITTAVNLLEVFSDDSSCEGCALLQRVTANTYDENCLSTFMRLADMTLAKMLQLTGIGCSINNRTPLILVEVPENEAQGLNQNSHNPELLDKKP